MDLDQDGGGRISSARAAGRDSRPDSADERPGSAHNQTGPGTPQRTPTELSRPLSHPGSVTQPVPAIGPSADTRPDTASPPSTNAEPGSAIPPGVDVQPGPLAGTTQPGAVSSSVPQDPGAIAEPGLSGRASQAIEPGSAGDTPAAVPATGSSDAGGDHPAEHPGTTSAITEPRTDGGSAADSDTPSLGGAEPRSTEPRAGAESSHGGQSSLGTRSPESDRTEPRAGAESSHGGQSSLGTRSPESDRTEPRIRTEAGAGPDPDADPAPRTSLPDPAGGPGAEAGAQPARAEYGTAYPAAPSAPARAPAAGNPPPKPRRIRILHLQEMKDRGEKWAMLTSYDQYTAEIFDRAGIPVLLVGDSAANNVYGYESTLRITVDELIPLARAVSGAVTRSLVVADLPFGSYQGSAKQAFRTAVRFMKEAGVHAVKLEGGRNVVPQVRKIVQAGIPVMAHIGFTPQSEHGLGGYRVQGRGDSGATLIEDAVALAEAGAFALVLEMVPGDLAAEITKRVPIPTIGIGAGRDCDAQVMVWQDMAGFRTGPLPRFVKQYTDLRTVLSDAAESYAAEVASGTFPSDEHTF